MGSCRQSIMPSSQSQSFLDTTRRPEVENKDQEMKLLYDKNLQTIMIELLMKKKLEEIENAMVSQLGMLSKEEDAIDSQLLAMKSKETDLRNLTELQESIDSQIIEIVACLGETNVEFIDKIFTNIRFFLCSIYMKMFEQFLLIQCY